jgi:hypothetical protein
MIGGASAFPAPKSGQLHFKDHTQQTHPLTMDQHVVIMGRGGKYQCLLGYQAMVRVHVSVWLRANAGWKVFYDSSGTRV